MWKQLPNFSKYEVNESGIVRNIKTGNNLKARINRTPRNNKGYFVFDMYNDSGNKKQLKRSRILAFLFIPNPENKPEVDHIDENPLNDSLDNLQWITRKDNCEKTGVSRKHSAYMPIDVEVLIRNLRAEGMTYKKISAITGFSQGAICNRLNGNCKGSTTIPSGSTA